MSTDVEVLLVSLHEASRRIEVLTDELDKERADAIVWAIRAEALADALRLVLPMAKGYAGAHDVGSNQRMVAEAAAALAPAAPGGASGTLETTIRELLIGVFWKGGAADRAGEGPDAYRAKRDEAVGAAVTRILASFPPPSPAALAEAEALLLCKAAVETREAVRVEQRNRPPSGSDKEYVDRHGADTARVGDAEDAALAALRAAEKAREGK